MPDHTTTHVSSRSPVRKVHRVRAHQLPKPAPCCNANGPKLAGVGDKHFVSRIEGPRNVLPDQCLPCSFASCLNLMLTVRTALLYFMGGAQIAFFFFISTCRPGILELFLMCMVSVKKVSRTVCFEFIILNLDSFDVVLPLVSLNFTFSP